jgi:hypothetical protein
MKIVTAAELLILDKRQFDKEHYEWQEYCMDGDDMDHIKEDFKERCEQLNIRVDDIGYCISNSQGDGAAFEGRVDLTAFMEREGLDITYPALYLGVKNDGSYILMRYSRNNCMRCGEYEVYANQTEPCGVFSGLDQQAWEELVDQQESAAGLEDLVLRECESLAYDLYDSLSDEYEHRTSEESFIESCECNDITFEIEEDESCV